MTSATELQWSSVASADVGGNISPPNVEGMEAVENFSNDGMEGLGGGGMMEEEPDLCKVFNEWQRNHRLAAKRDETTAAPPGERRARLP